MSTTPPSLLRNPGDDVFARELEAINSQRAQMGKGPLDQASMDELRAEVASGGQQNQMQPPKPFMDTVREFAGDAATSLANGVADPLIKIGATVSRRQLAPEKPGGPRFDPIRSLAGFGVENALLGGMGKAMRLIPKVGPMLDA